MGMDCVEIVMRVEDHFGIMIPNAEAVRVRTVGDLVSLIHGRITAAHEARCPTLAAFLKLRTTLREMKGDGTLRIRPRQRIVDVLNAPDRRGLWRRLAKLLGSTPSDLRRPRLLGRLLFSSVVLLMAVGLITAIVIDVNILPLTMVMAVFLSCCLGFVTRPFQTIPPVEWVTFGDVALKIASVTVATKNLHLRTSDEVLRELRPLMADQLGVEPDEIVADARFVEDLGMD